MIQIINDIVPTYWLWNYYELSIQFYCLSSTAGKPKLEELIAKDRELFLQILNTEVSLQILVDNISSDIFWKRCYKSKWNDLPLITEERKWINAFMARFYAEFLENLNPRQYDPEKVLTYY